MDNYEDHLIAIIESNLNRENYRLDKHDFKLQLISNPSYPSVKSITDTLDYFKVENVAAKVPTDALNELPSFFLAVLSIDGSTILAQVQNSKNKIKLLKDDGLKETHSVEAFKDIWDGTIVAIERNDTSKPASKVSSVNILLFLSLITVVLSLLNLQQLSSLIYSILASAGILLSYLIIREELGLYNKTTSKICNSASANTSCAGVIESRSARLFNSIKLTDASISFFIATLFTITFIGHDQTFFLLLAVFSVPVLLYSLYTQAFTVKKWCPLCLGIIGLITIFDVFATVDRAPLSLDWVYTAKSVLVFGLAYLSWITIKSLIKRSIELRKVKTDFTKFKRNDSIFNALLSQQIPGITNLNPGSEIIYGNPNAQSTITAVTNPLCGYCKNSFLAYDTILQTHGEHFQLKVVFNVSPEIKDEATRQITLRLIELYRQNPSKGYRAMKNWYESKNVEKWQTEYGLSEGGSSEKMLTEHYGWCAGNQISYTPATLIGDYFYPKEYDVDDLALLMDDIIEKQNNEIAIEKT